MGFWQACSRLRTAIGASRRRPRLDTSPESPPQVTAKEDDSQHELVITGQNIKTPRVRRQLIEQTKADRRLLNRPLYQLDVKEFQPACRDCLPLECFKRHGSRWTRATASGERQVLLFTDGACLNNGQRGARASWSVVTGPGDDRPRIVSGLVGRKGATGKSVQPTNNMAELYAVIHALRGMASSKEGFGSVVIATDSEYVVKGITVWIPAWVRNGWRTSSRQPVQNRGLWEDLLATIAKLEQEDKLHTKFWRIPREWNTVADVAAKVAVERGRARVLSS